MARPTHADSQRMVSLLDDSNAKLKVLGWMSEENLEQVAVNREKLSTYLHPDLVISLINHLTLIRHFNESNIRSDGRLLDLHDPDSDTEVTEEARSTADHLQKSTEELCRWLSRDKEAFKCLTTTIRQSSGAMTSLVEATSDLRKLFLNKLTTPVEEELNRDRELEEVDKRLTKVKADEALWSEKLTKICREREQGRESRNEELQKLKSEIEKVNRMTKDQLKRIKDQCDRTSKQQTQEFSDRIQQLKIQSKALSKEVNELRTENKDEQDKWLIKRQKMQTTMIEDNIKEYDKRMFDNTDQFDRESKAFEEHKKALEMIADHITQLRMERQRMTDENDREEAKRNQYDEVMKQKSQAAEYITAHWKGLKARQEYEKLKKTKLRRRRGK